MTDDSGTPPPTDPPELAPDSCPNCGGKLKFSENRPEGLCSSCGIFVEVLRPTEPKTPVRLLPSKIKIRTATTRELLLLCHKYGLPGGGSKKELVERLLFYVDEQGWQAKVRDKERETPPAPTPTEDVATRKEWAKFVMNFESELGDESLEDTEEKPAPETPAELRAEPVPVETVKALSTEPAPEPRPSETTPEPAIPEEEIPEGPEPADGEGPAPSVEESEVPPSLEAESVPAESPSTPEAEAAPEPVPEVEEVPPPEEEVVPEEPAAEPEVEPVAAEFITPAAPIPPERTSPLPAAEAVPARSRTPPIQRSRWRRAVYYVGVFYVTIGGAGLILGSFLHDIFRVPLFGYSYAAFGRLNLGAVLIGMILLGVGAAAMAVGMRRTPFRTRAAAGA